MVAATFMAVYHIFSDPQLLQRLRTSLTETLGTSRLGLTGKPICAELHVDRLCTNALLNSIYTEILRRHVMTHVLVSAPADEDVFVGRWMLPRGSVGVLNSGISHMDTTFWNTRNGQYPVTKFWAERFLVDPSDPDSGPINPAHRQGPYSQPSNQQRGENSEDKPYFSMEGTEGSWFPFGGMNMFSLSLSFSFAHLVLRAFGANCFPRAGGSRICTGRFLAKNSIFSTLAYMVLELEIEPLVDTMVVNQWRYGLGVNQPRHATPFRFKKRQTGRE